MVWKRIINKKTAARQKTKQEDIQREVYQHAAGLAEEMNLRLLLELEPEAGDPLLWIESIAVTGLEFPVREKISFWEIVRKIIKQIIRALSAEKR